ncbi:MAG: septal ring lytic transglycosylase RlpA family protein [Terriglobales bacterium]
MRRVLPCIMAMLVLVATVGAAPATKGPRSTKQGPPKRQKPYEIGRASWYGKPFHGRATASGEPYDMFQFTAAHRELPLGTWVKVTNLRNGKWLMVRINDRGPVPESRIIDLSYGAAAMLEFRHTGVERVQLDIVPAQMVATAQNMGGE